MNSLLRYWSSVVLGAFFLLLSGNFSSGNEPAGKEDQVVLHCGQSGNFVLPHQHTTTGAEVRWSPGQWGGGNLQQFFKPQYACVLSESQYEALLQKWISFSWDFIPSYNIRSVIYPFHFFW